MVCTAEADRGHLSDLRETKEIGKLVLATESMDPEMT